MIVQRELTAEALRDAYEHGQRRFEGIEIVGESEFPVVVGLNLSAADFSNCWFHSATFRGVNLDGASFTGCNLKCSTFEDCNLRGTKWHKCAVCSIVIATSETGDLEVAGLDAYGAPIEDPGHLIEYATENLKRRERGPDA